MTKVISIESDKGCNKAKNMKLKIGGWVQLNQNIVYENPWIKVCHDHVVRPNGSEGIYGVVKLKLRGVGIVPIDNFGNTWLVRQSRYAINKKTWEIPKGGAIVGESAINCAQRELNEEVGIIAKNWQLLLDLHTSTSISDESCCVYLAQDIHHDKQLLDETEDIEVRKIPLSLAVKMASEGEISDATSVCALLKAANIVHVDKLAI